MDESSKSFSRISGLDPIIVAVPPRMMQKPTGIRRRDMGIPVRAETRLTTGRNNAATPMFCMKLEASAAIADMSGLIRVSVLPPILRIS